MPRRSSGDIVRCAFFHQGSAATLPPGQISLRPRFFWTATRVTPGKDERRLNSRICPFFPRSPVDSGESRGTNPLRRRLTTTWPCVGTSALAMLNVDYDGQRLAASFIPASSGTLTVRVTGLDEDLLAD